MMQTVSTHVRADSGTFCIFRTNHYALFHHSITKQGTILEDTSTIVPTNGAAESTGTKGVAFRDTLLKIFGFLLNIM